MVDAATNIRGKAGTRAQPLYGMKLPLRALLVAALLACAEIEHVVAISCKGQRRGDVAWWVAIRHPEEGTLGYMFHEDGMDKSLFPVRARRMARGYR